MNGRDNPIENDDHWHRALIGLGGNIGDVRAHMLAALEALCGGDDVRLMRSSGIYETPPWGIEDQPVFLNSCIEVSSRLGPEKLLEKCHQAERALKRQRTIRWGPRTIDLDILLMENVNFESEHLRIPHPRISQRAFVLVPLSEIAPDWMLEGKSIAQLCEEVDKGGVVKIADHHCFDALLWSGT